MPLNKAQKIFVEEMVRHGDEDLAVEIAYPQLKGNNKQIRTYCGRLMKNEEIASVIHQRSSEIQQLATSEATESLKNEIVSNALTAIEKRNLLSEIAKGSARIQESFMKWNKKGEPEMETWYREPTAFEKIKAIEVDNKMAGDNAVIKQDLTSKGESVILTEEKVMQILNHLK
jgi:hypothetical protein